MPLSNPPVAAGYIYEAHPASDLTGSDNTANRTLTPTATMSANSQIWLSGQRLKPTDQYTTNLGTNTITFLPVVINAIDYIEVYA